VTGNEALADAIAILRTAGVADAPGDARRLFARALGLDPARVVLALAEPLADPAPFRALIARRAAREPVAKILGQRDFYGRSFAVTPDVLDPRPETELIVELALSGSFRQVLDLGTGTGCILLTLLAERPFAEGIGTDLSAAALAVARQNAEALGLGPRASFAEGSWFEPVPGRFDLIVSNPPYVAAAEMPGLAPEVRDWDPALALTDGGDGLSAYRAIAAGASGRLTAPGRLIVEIGWQQGAAVCAIFRAAGLEDVSVHTDLERRDRAVSAVFGG
jgi:release factor glutamine methyltransferase